MILCLCEGKTEEEFREDLKDKNQGVPMCKERCGTCTKRKIEILKEERNVNEHSPSSK
jgi:bacterioferritin-associated ferredoxin